MPEEEWVAYVSTSYVDQAIGMATSWADFEVAFLRDHGRTEGFSSTAELKRSAVEQGGRKGDQVVC